MNYDKFSTGKSVLAVSYQTISSATTTSGEIIDTKGYGSIVVSMYADFTTGNITALTFQEGDESDLSDAATLDDSELLINDGQLPATTDGVLRWACISKKRYIRPRITTTGTVSIVVYAMAELNDAISSPPQVASSVLETSEINSPDTEADTVVTHPKRTS